MTNYKCNKCGHRWEGPDDCASVRCWMPGLANPEAPCYGVFVPDQSANTLAERYPQYYKDVSELSEVDVYMVHYLFRIDDPSGCLQHADKKILLSGVRTGGKPKRKDIEEARDTLTRWLEINEVAPE